MAQAALGIVGGIVGYVVGGPFGASMGYAIGATAGGYIDRANADPIRGPRLQDLTVSASTYGLPIPRVWGVRRLPGNMIWSTGLVEREAESGGKGGDSKGPRQVQYEYSASFAHGFCAGPADAVLRIWMDAQLVFDATGSGEELAVPGLRFRFHAGGEDQMPDPAIEAHVGAGNAPAHRGLCYIVFEQVPLKYFGNRIPQVSAEIAVSASSAPVVRNVEAAPGVPTPTLLQLDEAAVDWDRKMMFREVRVSGDDGIAVVDLATGRQVRVATMAELTEGLDLEALNVDEFVSQTVGRIGGSAGGGAFFWQFLSHPGSVLVKADPLTLKPLATFGQRSNTGFNTSAQWQAATHMRVFTVPSQSGLRTFVAATGPLHDLKIIDGDNMLYLFGAQFVGGQEVNHRIVPNWPYLVDGASFVIPGALRAIGGQPPDAERDLWYWNGAAPTVTGGDRWWDVWRIAVGGGAVTTFGTVGGAVQVESQGISHLHVARLRVGDIDPSWDWFDIRLCEYDATDDTFILVVKQAPTGSAVRVLKWSPDNGVVWNVPAAVQPDTAVSYGSSRLQGDTYGFGGTTPGRWQVVDTRTGEMLWDDTVPGAEAAQARFQAWDSRSASAVHCSNAGAGDLGAQRIFFFRASGEGAPLATVVRDLCVAAGLEESDIDASELSGTVRGFASGVQSARADLEQLMQAYFFTGVEADGQIVFRHRGAAPVATIAYEDLVRVDDRPALQDRRTPPLELPRRATVHFLDADKDGQANAAQWARARAPVAITDANGEGGLDLSQLVLTFDEAKTIARRWLTDAYFSRWRWDGVRLPPKHLGLLPGDAVTLTMRDGSAARVVLDRADIGADFTLECALVAEDAVAWALEAEGDGGSGFPEQRIPAPYLSKLLWPEMPLLDDADDLGGNGLRIYAAAGGYAGQDFLGASLYYGTGDDTWARAASLLTAATWGTVLQAPGAPASPWRTDRTGTVRVSIQSGADALQTVTRAQMLAGLNRAALIAPTGEVEVIGFQEVTEEEDGTFTLSTLLRGRRGTDWACGLHGPGSLFLLLAAPALRGLALPAGDLNATRYGRLVGRFDVFDATPAQLRTARGEAEKPYSPVHVTGARDEFGNLTIAWVRRTRIGGVLPWRGASLTAPLGEESEAYEVEILDGDGEVVRTITGLTTPSASYSAEDQTSDFGAPQASVAVKVYQVSALVGRGRPRAATV